MPSRGRRRGLWLGTGTLTVLVILAAAGAWSLASGPLRFDCTVQVAGHNMQVEVSGFLAGHQCDDLISTGQYVNAGVSLGSMVCSYPIGMRQYTVRDTGLQLLAAGECSNLQQHHHHSQSSTGG